MDGRDFWQYYTGSLVVWNHCWESLYPKPNPEIYDKAPDFKPVVNIKPFKISNPEALKGRWAFYKQICFPEASEVSPRLVALCPQLEQTYRYMYPPPTALLLSPLGFWEAGKAVEVWFFVLCWSLFGISFFSAGIAKHLWGESSYVVGSVALLPVIATLMGSEMTVGIEYGNVTPLLGCLVAAGAYAWLKDREAAISFAIIPLVLFKGLAISWCPLLLFKPVKWKSILGLAMLTVILNGIVLWLGGMEVYRTFLGDILPKASIPVGMSLQRMILQFFGINASPFFAVVNLLLLGLLYFGFYKASSAAGLKQKSLVITATLAGTIAVFCLCNPVLFPHYISIYLLYPFAGWVLWEKSQTKGIWGALLLFIMALSIIAWFDAILFLKNSVLFEWLRSTGRYHEWMGKIRVICNSFPAYILPLGAPVIILGLAYRRLFLLGKIPAEPSPERTCNQP